MNMCMIKIAAQGILFWSALLALALVITNKLWNDKEEKAD